MSEPPPDEPPPQASEREEAGNEPRADDGPGDFVWASFGVTALSDASGWSTLIAAVSEPGILGCALVQDGVDTPADPLERIRVKLEVGIDGASSLCPEGTYPLRNDAICAAELLANGCARYERWDDDGEPAVQLPAAGGAVAIGAQLDDSGFQSGCTVELDLRFAGGSRFAHTFEFATDPFDPEARTCVHDE